MAPNHDSHGFCWHELEPHEVQVKLADEVRSQGHSVSGFLDTHQWVALVGTPGLELSGGYGEAQFRLAAIACGTPAVRYWSVDRMSLPGHMHKPHQLRSWFYRMHAPDSSIGDIIMGDTILVITEPDIELAEFGVKASIVAEFQMPVVKPERLTTAANRADAMVSTLFNVSRNEAQTALKYGFIFRNFTELSKRTQPITAGEHLVYRTKGRVEVLSIDLNPKSKRMWVEFKRFPC